MRTKYKIGFLILVALGVLLGAAWWLHGANIPVLKPQGTVGQQERQLILIALALSLIVVIPVFILLAVFAWKYREGNAHKAKYSPELDHNRLAEIVWWLIPAGLILILSVLAWRSSHALDPFKPLASSTKPMTIQVVALDWKWLFIYPEQHIATVNVVEFPQNTPITFETTSDTVMNSFWIPSLGGQIYSMPGMSTEVHLMAKQQGSYRGSSANISGAGFSGMTFTATSSSAGDFASWVQSVKKSPNRLTQATYNELAKPSKNNAPAYYSSADQTLYDTIVLQYMTPGKTMQTVETQ